ncbi:ribose transport system ATP-binding protein/rhamnose transport system ATP-binding protein [Nocardioides salarius]|uniref:Ribose transport system ATP-binding protein/rhamnose transport system ATP-binding protein n=1 Tax=Nocardioides salarius TaxID=374513 RepID=A0ABS2M9M4_9ACTN|nr:sugar ABC transporter ATP-binding protein [Nocardioides salarius]MBM7507904.1 ribose transport system ATP-binding protein/rhamnose transport system ATP-binding protein [Nocardioides salarius]
MFSGAVAVQGADLTVRSGEVHALVGENGAGKSTLLGMISGRLGVDGGTVEVFGRRLRGADPRESREHGLVTVYQELTMVPGLSAEANVFLGQTRTRRGLLDRRWMRRRYLELCEELDVHVPPDATVRALSVSQQQMLEIMRGVQSDARIVVLDEPTAALAEHERETLYRVLRTLTARGTTIVFVSHNLDEVLDLSDTITVLRDGAVVRSAARSEWTRPTLIEHMVGRAVDKLADRGSHPLGAEVLHVEDVNLPGVLSDIAMTARAGEIVGLWGLVGSGRTTFLRSLAGAEPASRGVLRLRGEERSWPGRVRHSVDAGVVMVPESRKQALVLGMDGASNYWLGRPGGGRPFLDRGAERAEAGRTGEFFAFDRRRLGEPVRNLSGGNQQKVLLAKWAGHRPDVFLIDEPTRGIDIGAKAEVLTSLVRLAEEGAAVVVTSSELEEVLAIANRLLVFAHGRVVREISADDPEFTVDAVVHHGFSPGEKHEPAH